MAIVSVEDLEKAEKKKQDETPKILTKTIGDKTVYSHSDIVKEGLWFESSGEALQEVTNRRQQKIYKDQGLNELGQTPQQVEKNKRIKSLIEEKEKLIDQLSKIDAEIGRINSAPDSEFINKPEKKKK